MNSSGVYHAPPYPAIAVIAALLALLALWGFLARLRRKRLVADTPQVRLRSAAQGYVKVVGRSAPAPAAATAAPLTSRPCVWWAFTIAEQRRDSKGNARWETIDSGTSVEPFALLDDDGGRCLVGPVEAEVTPTAHNVWYGESLRPDAPPGDSVPLLHQGSYRYTERLVGIGERLCVLGQLRSHSETGNAGAAAAAKLHEWKQDQQALLARFDLDHDGRLNDAEWEAARTAAAREAQGETLQSPIERESIISQPVNGEPFLITPLTSGGIERRERLFAAVYFSLGLVCVAVCAWAIRHV